MKKTYIILFLLIVTIIGIVIIMNARKEATIEQTLLHGGMPGLVIYYNDKAGINQEERVYIGGCTWKLDTHVEVIENAVYRNHALKTFEMKDETVVQLKPDFIIKPDQLKVKLFRNEDIKDYSKGVVIAIDEEEIICNPGYSYAVELTYGENEIMFPFRCK